MSLTSFGAALPFNGFDLVLVVVLIGGFLLGRKNGMSEELLPLVQWLIIIFGSAQLYQPLGQMLADATALSLLSSYIIAYISVAIAVKLLLTGFKYLLKGKLIGGDAFGEGEYYLGMTAGMVRFGCGVIAILAVLNARSFTRAEIEGDIKFQKDVYGSEFFPKLYTVQQMVFEKSATGSLIKQNLGFLLIKPTAPENKQRAQRKNWEMP